MLLDTGSFQQPMKTRIQYIWELLSGSFWFMPLMLIIMYIFAATGLIYLDSISSWQPQGAFTYIMPASTESARTVLSVVAGAMLGVAGTVFSITLVALTMASSNLGPRLLRNFMYKRLNQFVLGAFVALFLYALVVLQSVKSAGDNEFIPYLSVFFTLVASLLNIFMLVVFIHQISVSIQADYVISDVNKNLNKSIRRLFPVGLGEVPDTINHTAAWEEACSRLPVESVLYQEGNGYLQAIENENLMELASDNDLVITLDYRPGDYIVEKTELVSVRAKDKTGEELEKKIRDCFILGKVRTPTQDAEFAIHQMVEVAARALSKGVNDPYTALTCIDKLTASLCYLVRARFPEAFRYDQDNVLRMKTRPVSFAGMMDASFNLIRQSSEDNPSVVIRMAEGLGKIYLLAQGKQEKDAVLRHAQMIYRLAEKSFTEKNDLEDLKVRFQNVDLPFFQS